MHTEELFSLTASFQALLRSAQFSQWLHAVLLFNCFQRLWSIRVDQGAHREGWKLYGSICLGLQVQVQGLRHKESVLRITLIGVLSDATRWYSLLHFALLVCR